MLHAHHFNSRPHEEVDTRDGENRCLGCISTHDLAKRSTFLRLGEGRRILISTHNLAKRSTAQIYKLKQEQLFQLTTSRGGRLLQLLSLPIPDLHFNSRPHKEVDVIAEKLYSIINISTHDLTRRSTMALRVTETSTDVFQLTTSRRGRLVFAITPPVHPSFNSRPHEEVDVDNNGYGDRYVQFQLTTSRRGRPPFQLAE